MVTRSLIATGLSSSGLSISPAITQAGRHIFHFKVRLFSGATRTYEFTSQLCFDDSLTDQVYTLAPYNTKPARGTRNNNDNIYQSAGDCDSAQRDPRWTRWLCEHIRYWPFGVPASLQSVATVSATNYSPDAVTRTELQRSLVGSRGNACFSSFPPALPVTLGGIQVLARDVLRFARSDQFSGS